MVDLRNVGNGLKRATAGLMVALIVGFATVTPLGALNAGTSWSEGLSPSLSWSVVPSPNPEGTTNASLSAVSCVSAAWCMAVGLYTGANGYLNLAEEWTSSAWQVVPTPDAAKAKDEFLSGVSCTSAQWCLAVGSAISARAVEEPVVEDWDGATWSTVPTPLHARATGGLNAVSCTSEGPCMAVGGFSVGLGQAQPLAEAWDGSTMEVVPTPNPQAENGSELASVSCTSVDACSAQGNYAYADVNQGVFALRWDGTNWTIERQANPGGEDDNVGLGISCSGRQSCTSVGSWQDLVGNGEALAEQWDGSAWARETTPAAKGAGLNAVSCPAAGCMAVGQVSSGNDRQATLAEAWDGSSWSLQTTLNPAGAEISTLDGVSCSSTGCTAVGSSWDGTVTSTLVETASL
jgi:hypothetical protein